MNNLPAELKREWTGQNLQIEALKRRLRSGQIYWRALLGFSLTAAAVGMATGIWFVFEAIRQRDLLHALSAFALLTAVPAAAIAEFRARRQAFNWHDQTPEGTIREALRRTVITGRLLRITFFNACVLAALVAVVSTFMVVGLISNEPRVVAVIAIWLVFAIGAVLWVQWRSHKNRCERERCEKLLTEYAAAESSAADMS